MYYVCFTPWDSKAFLGVICYTLFIESFPRHRFHLTWSLYFVNFVCSCDCEVYPLPVQLCGTNSLGLRNNPRQSFIMGVNSSDFTFNSRESQWGEDHVNSSNMQFLKFYNWALDPIFFCVNFAHVCLSDPQQCCAGDGLAMQEGSSRMVSQTQNTCYLFAFFFQSRLNAFHSALMASLVKWGPMAYSAISSRPQPLVSNQTCADTPYL